MRMKESNTLFIYFCPKQIRTLSCSKSLEGKKSAKIICHPRVTKKKFKIKQEIYLKNF